MSKMKNARKHLSDGCISLTIPSSVENLQLPDSSLLQYYVDIENRIIWLEGEINDYCSETIKQILNWNRADMGKPATDRKPIHIMIYSIGGDMDMCYALSDAIMLSKTPIFGVNMGIASSAACFIFLSCKKRFALPNAQFLLHRGSVEGLSGSYAEIVGALENYQRQVDKLCQKILDTTKIHKEDLDENMQADWYMNAQEALRYGVCDEIVTDIDTIM